MTSNDRYSSTLTPGPLGAAFGGTTDPAADPAAVEAYLAGVEAAIDARVDARVEQRLAGAGRRLHVGAGNFTSRAIGSLAVGIPLTAVAGGIASHAGGLGAVVGVLGALSSIVTLNIYFTEVEKDLEKERIRAGKP